jgi:hypothetical protein
MKNLLRAIFAVTFVAMLVMSASVPSNAVAAQAARPSAFDGRWSVVIYTLRGDCDRSLRYSLRIVDGQVQADEQSYQLAGKVTPNGEIRVVVAEAGRTASGTGRLIGNNGRGEWRTSTGQCAGQWTAMRRAADY